MKIIIVLLTFLSASAFAQSEKEVQKKAEKAILEWAGKTFEFYDAPRFENFYLSPSPEFYAMGILKEEYVTFKDEIVYNFKEGKSERSEEEVKADTTSINTKIVELDNMMNMIDPKFDHIEYFFWANIQTDNGLTVYYQHQIKLDENYKIISYRESSSIGKPDNVNILLK